MYHRLMVILFRSGGNPGLDRKPGANSIRFDSYVPIPKVNTPRSDAVFVALTLEVAENWIDYRLDGGLDADLYAIHIPEDVAVYAHNIRLFEDACYANTMDGYNKTSMTVKANEYWSSSCLVTPETCSSIEEVDWWEVLLPSNLADSIEWELLKKVDPQDYPVGDEYDWLTYHF